MDVENKESLIASICKVSRVFSACVKVLACFFATIFLAVFTVFGACFILIKGPSESACKIFVQSLLETSAAYWVPSLFLTDDEIAALRANSNEQQSLQSAAIKIKESTENDDEEEESEEKDYFYNEDGIIIEKIQGSTYQGYIAIIEDPGRVCMGVPEKFGKDEAGRTLSEMAEAYGAMIAINAGGFWDNNGKGLGGLPTGLTVYDGIAYIDGVESESRSSSYCFVGFDSDHIMHVGYYSAGSAQETDIQFGCTFGPILVADGVPQSQSNSTSVNPRTAIGQREDGAVLMLVVDGRQASSLGATLTDLVDIMIEYGAKNAMNLDGGSSTNLYFNGKMINNSSSIVGERELPTAFLVK